MQLIRLFLVDDHRIVREGLASMLATQADMQVVGEASTGDEALARMGEVRPDILLLDLEMPGLDGVSVLERVRTDLPSIRTIILTAYGSDQRILDAVRAGAHGYLLKGAGLDEVLHAVRVVAAGGSLLEPAVTERLLGSMEQLLRSGSIAEMLTERERMILTYMAQGFSNKMIGQELHLAERTVKFHTTILFQKLQASNRAQAVAKALQERLIPFAPPSPP
ncbi:response regulator [Ktedonobacter racemifer]|uniref:Two component transcriptional regulator, LuxR family n=1 Tax=Ktedonobacter racemifer DSM 44963 TaxID=485913 RepID=D6TC16_KTERA|nr:response regulator transcription factor [Ktedonobacter racemifer]EFH88052.1 two component transcriptional regulator, LuxR family [Ktedonobacter racemifer DSM 44963]